MKELELIDDAFYKMTILYHCHIPLTKVPNIYFLNSKAPQKLINFICFLLAFVFKDLSPNEAMGLPTDITSNYYISRKLGSGACGLVRLVYDRRTCQQYAMKIVKKNMLATSANPNHLNDPNRVMNEAKIMKSLEHVSIIILKFIWIK